MLRAQQGGLARWLVRVSSHRGFSLGVVVTTAMADHVIHMQELSFVPRALMDEPCHLATALVVLGALIRWRGRSPSRWFIWAMLSASVLIDIDHLPLAFGSTAWTAGTPRPYTHALWVVAALTAVALIADHRARVHGSSKATILIGLTAGAAWGVGAHFLRDVVTAPIALWWPLSSAGVQLPYAWYSLALLILAVAGRPRAAGPT